MTRSGKSLARRVMKLPRTLDAGDESIVVGKNSTRDIKAAYVRHLMLTGEYWGGSRNYLERKARRVEIGRVLGISESRVRQYAGEEIKAIWSQRDNIEQHVRLILQEISDDPDPANRIAAVREINKMIGAYAAKKHEVAVKPHMLSNEELERRLEQQLSNPDDATKRVLERCGWRRIEVLDTEGEANGTTETG